MAVFDLKVRGITKTGFPIELTISPGGDETIVDAMRQAAKLLEDMQVKPAPPNILGVPLPPPATVETKECPIHHVPMQRRQKGNAVWYSHKVVEPDGREWWCKGKEK